MTGADAAMTVLSVNEAVQGVKAAKQAASSTQKFYHYDNSDPGGVNNRGNYANPNKVDSRFDKKPELTGTTREKLLTSV